jgi:hypothetical protein
MRDNKSDELKKLRFAGKVVSFFNKKVVRLGRNNRKLAAKLSGYINEYQKQENNKLSSKDDVTKSNKLK